MSWVMNLRLDRQLLDSMRRAGKRETNHKRAAMRTVTSAFVANDKLNKEPFQRARDWGHLRPNITQTRRKTAYRSKGTVRGLGSRKDICLSEPAYCARGCIEHPTVPTLGTQPTHLQTQRSGAQARHRSANSSPRHSNTSRPVVPRTPYECRFRSPRKIGTHDYAVAEHGVDRVDDDLCHIRRL